MYASHLLYFLGFMRFGVDSSLVSYFLGFMRFGVDSCAQVLFYDADSAEAPMNLRCIPL